MVPIAIVCQTFSLPDSSDPGHRNLRSIDVIVEHEPVRSAGRLSNSQLKRSLSTCLAASFYAAAIVRGLVFPFLSVQSSGDRRVAPIGSPKSSGTFSGVASPTLFREGRTGWKQSRAGLARERGLVEPVMARFTEQLVCVRLRSLRAI